jgi:hypothetical protein
MTGRHTNNLATPHPFSFSPSFFPSLLLSSFSIYLFLLLLSLILSQKDRREKKYIGNGGILIFLSTEYTEWQLPFSGVHTHHHDG